MKSTVSKNKEELRFGSLLKGFCMPVSFYSTSIRYLCVSFLVFASIAFLDQKYPSSMSVAAFDLGKRLGIIGIFSSLSALALGLFFPSCMAALFIIIRNKKNKQSAHSKKQVETPTGVSIETKETKNQPSKITITNKEEFKKAFIPYFWKPQFPDGGQDRGFITLVETLEEGIWSITDLGRIALILWCSNVVNPKYDDFRAWMKMFFEMLGRQDCPENPDRGSYKHFYQNGLDKIFPNLVSLYEDRVKKGLAKDKPKVLLHPTDTE